MSLGNLEKIDSSSEWQTSLIEIIQQFKEGLEKNEFKSFLRIVLNGFGSIDWAHAENPFFLNKFLYVLKGAIKGFPILCFIGAYTYFLSNPVLSCLTDIADYRVRLVSRNREDPEEAEFDGLLEVKDFYFANTALLTAPHLLDNLVFKVRRGRLYIEKLSLSPLEADEQTAESLMCAASASFDM